MKLYPLLPLIFILAYVFVAVSIVLDYKKNDYAALTGIGVLAFFTGLYFVVRSMKPNDNDKPNSRSLLHNQ